MTKTYFEGASSVGELDIYTVKKNINLWKNIITKNVIIYIISHFEIYFFFKYVMIKN